MESETISSVANLIVIVYLRFKNMFSFTFFTFYWKFTISYSKHQSNNKEWAFYHTVYFKYTHRLCLRFSINEPKVGQSRHILKILDWSPRNFHFKLHHTSTEPHGGQWLILTSNFYVHGNKISIIFHRAKMGAGWILF